MKIGILGSGHVGQALANGLLKLGHEVLVGTRDRSKLTDWASKAGKGASVGNFSEAAGFGDIVFIATLWTGTENAIKMAGKHNFSGKIVVDVTNPLKVDKAGEPPNFAVAYPNSAGSLVQRWLPDAKVVKAFNMTPAHYMTNPKLQDGEIDLFIAGNDSNAKNKVKEIAAAFGWKDVHDLGGIEQAYLVEAVAMTWIRYAFLNNHWMHGWKLLKK